MSDKKTYEVTVVVRDATSKKDPIDYKSIKEDGGAAASHHEITLDGVPTAESASGHLKKWLNSHGMVPAGGDK